MGHGSNIFLSIDPFIGSYENYKLSNGIIANLHKKNIVFLQQVKTIQVVDGSYWISAKDINLDGQFTEEWDIFVNTLLHVGIILTNQDDVLV